VLAISTGPHIPSNAVAQGLIAFPILHGSSDFALLGNLVVKK
jgi:hypothetical protein